MIFLTMFVYPPPSRKSHLEHPKTKHLVYGLSYPKWSLVEKAKCEDMRRNRMILDSEGKSVNCESPKCSKDSKGKKRHE